MLIPLVASCIPADGGHRVDLANADVVILVEVLKNVCGIGAIEGYERLGKLNVQTLAQRVQTANAAARPAAHDATPAEPAAEVAQHVGKPDATPAKQEATGVEAATA